MIHYGVIVINLGILLIQLKRVNISTGIFGSDRVLKPSILTALPCLELQCQAAGILIVVFCKCPTECELVKFTSSFGILRGLGTTVSSLSSALSGPHQQSIIKRKSLDQFEGLLRFFNYSSQYYMSCFFLFIMFCFVMCMLFFF